MDIQGRVAIVTGGGSGIGRGTALRLAREGAAVVVADVDAAGGSETVRQIQAALAGPSAAQAGRAAFVPTDVASPADVQAMVAFAEQTFGGLDILVNNAGTTAEGGADRASFPDLEPERWIRMLDVNLRGVILGTQYGVQAMRRRGGGAIINIASGAGIGFGAHGSPVYAASKAGVARFSAALSNLKASMNVRVNCVCPGWVDTPMTQRTRAALTPEQYQAIVPTVMLKPDDIADAIVELIRDDSLAGRVMLCYEGEPRRLLPVRSG